MDKPGLQDGRTCLAHTHLVPNQACAHAARATSISPDLASGGQLYDIAGLVGSEYNGGAISVSGRLARVQMIAARACCCVTSTVARRSQWHVLTHTQRRAIIQTHAASDDHVVRDGHCRPRAQCQGGYPHDQRWAETSEPTIAGPGEVRIRGGGPTASMSWLRYPINGPAGGSEPTPPTRLTGPTQCCCFKRSTARYRGDLLVWHWQYSIVAAHLGDSVATPVVIATGIPRR